MEKRRSVDAAFRKAVAGVRLGEIAVELDEDGAGGLIIMDLPVQDGDEDGTLDAFLDAHQAALQEVARRQGGPETALRVSVHCGTKKWLSEQNMRTGSSTVIRVGPGRGDATCEQRPEVASTPVMTRLRGDAVTAIDLLVESGVVRSRSLAVAWCVDRALQREAARIEALRAPVAAIREARQALSDVTVTTSGSYTRVSDATGSVYRRAQAEAKERNRAIQRPVHLLLALLRERPPLAMAALQGVGVDVDALAAKADAAAARADPPQPQHTEPSVEFRDVIGKFAMEAAQSLGQVVKGPDAAAVPHEVEPEHLLLGLLRAACEGEGYGIPFLAEIVGADGVARVRTEVMRLQKKRSS